MYLSCCISRSGLVDEATRRLHRVNHVVALNVYCRGELGRGLKAQGIRSWDVGMGLRHRMKSQTRSDRPTGGVRDDIALKTVSYVSVAYDLWRVECDALRISRGSYDALYRCAECLGH